MKVALIQMKVCDSNNTNIDTAITQIKEASQNGVDIVVLPEMFCCPYKTENFPIYAQPENGYNYQKLSETAKENSIYLVAGSMPEIEEGKIYNTSYTFDRNGNKIGKYRKIHLFDIDVEGGQRFMESDTLTAGNTISLIDTEFGKIGIVICFDFRFPELARIMALQGAQAIIVPAAFNMTTGPAHWEILFRTRALDNQLFTIGASPARDITSFYHSYGNSIVVSPWGDIIERLDEKENILYAELDMNKVGKVRKQLPMLSARREDVYQLTEVSI